MSTLYGSLQNGGGVNRFFQNTKLNDVLLFTNQNNNIVLGNYYNGQSNNAGLYISSNSIGINKLPTIPSSNALDVGGNVNIDFGYTLNAPNINSSNINIGSNINVNSNGFITTNNSVASKLPFRRLLENLLGLQVISINTNKLEVQLYGNIRTKLLNGMLLMIKGLTYVIRTSVYDSITFNTVLTLVDYYNPATTTYNFTVGEYINPNLYEEITDSSTSSSSFIVGTVNTFSFTSDNVSVDTTLTIKDTSIVQYLEPNTIVVIESSTTTFKYMFWITSANFNVNTNILSIRFRSIDNASDIVSSISPFLTTTGLLYIFPVQASVDTFTITETNLRFARYVTANSEYSIAFRTDTLLKQWANNSDNRLSSILSITVSFTGGVYPVNYYYIEGAQQNLVVNLRNIDVLPLTGDTNITYTLIGKPIQIQSVTQVNAYRLRYTLTFNQTNNDMLQKLKSYEEYNIFIIDSWYTGVWLVNSVDICNYILDISIQDSGVSIDPRALNPRTLFTIPYKMLNLTKIVNNVATGYIPYKLAVGSRIVNPEDTVTIAGNVSLTNTLRWYGENYYSFYPCMSNVSSNSFFQSYDANTNTFNINNQIAITNDNIYFNTDAMYNSTVTALEFRSPSDISLKTEITDSDSHDDLMKLLKLQVKDFKYKGNNEKSKGVIAQEIETIIPEAVSTKFGVVPNLCVWTLLLGENSCRTLPEILEEVSIGCVIRLIYGKKSHDVMITSIDHKEIRFTPKIDIINSDKEQKVFVYGARSDYKVVNYDYLFCMCMNAIKALHKIK